MLVIVRGDVAELPADEEARNADGDKSFCDLMAENEMGATTVPIFFSSVVMPSK